MCGIVGKLNLNGAELVEPVLIQRMMDAVAHRGPDGEGRYVSGRIGLGHRRLSILDLDAGSQPMSNEDGTIWIVYNGEIYNFLQLRAELLSRGHVFSSNTDTEVVVHLYEELGADAVARLDGMFAFALWDERRQLLLLARDRVGIKPLYYTHTGKAVLFGSEIKSLLVDPSVERRFSARAVDRFLTYYYLPGTESLFEGISKLEPGHTLTITAGQVTKRQYWDLRFDHRGRWANSGDAVEALRALMSRTVKNHMISDVPVGVLLSGGVDSTAVLRYAVEQTGERVRTFTVGFDAEGFVDERPYARMAADQYGTEHQDTTINAQEFGDLLPKYAWHMEEAVCEPPALALFVVSRLARQAGIKVLLSGEGADEAFGGYNKYRYIVALEKLKAACGPALGALKLGLEALGSVGWQRLGKYAEYVQLPLPEYYFSCTSTPSTGFNRHKLSLYEPAFSSSLGAQFSHEPTRSVFRACAQRPVLDQMLFVDTKTWLPDDLLVKADKMTMATSVELRVPFLDAHVLEFAASLPPHLKVTTWTTKRVLRSALQGSVPPAILNRKKMGFPLPYDRWLRNELKDFVFDTVLARDGALTSYFRRPALLDLVEAHQRGEGYSQEVFSLIVLELLHQQFIKGVTASRADARTVAVDFSGQ